MNNAELIKALRYHADATIFNCDGCPYQTIHKTNGMCIDRMIMDAADALETAERLLDLNTKRCEALRKQLRESHESYEKHINELEAKIPKEGEWIEVHDWIHIPQEERGTYRCSACGQVMKYPWNYCPNCGAKMDGKRKEGAE